MSLRAIGEGHISSIEFRTGVLSADGGLTLDETPPFAVTGRKAPHEHDKAFFVTKLRDLGALNEIEEAVLAQLDDSFSITELEAAIARLDEARYPQLISRETAHVLHWLASSNYRTSFRADSSIAERVLFPSGPTESRGMEDARFVRFTADDGEVTYYATYTAYDGHQILPQLLETADFETFEVSTMTGRAAHNKGMALFPRQVDGRYVALGRHDNVNNFVMYSDDVRVWRDASLLQQPECPWELMQLGNCGSPLETEAGWIVITHGVGPFRTYSIGALLLDLDDPEPGDRPPRPAADHGERRGARGVRPERRVLVREHAARRPGRDPLRLRRRGCERGQRRRGRPDHCVDHVNPGVGRVAGADACRACWSVEIIASVDSAPWFRLTPTSLSPS